MTREREEIRWCARLWFAAVGDDEILNAVVDIIWQDAAVEQVPLGAVGPEAHDARGPGGGHAGDFEQIADAGAIDVDAGGGRRDALRAWCGVRGGGGRLRDGARSNRENADRKRCGSKHRELRSSSHGTILRPSGSGRKKRIDIAETFP